MTAEEVKTITIHPIAGIDFQMVPEGVAVTVRYYAPKKERDATTNEVQFSNVVQSLTVGFTADQAKVRADSFQRAAQMIESRTSPNK
jgi:hypothetical protein